MKHYEDNFAHDHLPPPELQAECFTGHPDFEFDGMLNCVDKLLDNHIKEGRGDSIAIRTFDGDWTFRELYEKANRIAHVLTDNLDFVPGNRVMIRSANNPMYVACWFGILKAGGIVVATMPLLREKELSVMIECAEISHVLCDYTLEEALLEVRSPFLKHIITFSGSGS
ncbi:MAG: 2-aminobenzoate-CoA ligase, partial [Chitinophagaceae bacterium]